MNRIFFTAPGNPKAQMRHRSWQRGKAKGTYDPSEGDKADFPAIVMNKRPPEPIPSPVYLFMVFWMPVPKSATKKFKGEVHISDTHRRQAPGHCVAWTAALTYAILYATDISDRFSILGRMPRPPVLLPEIVIHAKRPDTDNLVKLVKDALTGVYWKDDSQVQIGGAFKLYSHTPRTEVELLW